MSEQHLYTGNDLSLDHAHNYTLLLRVDANHFSYAIVNDKQLLTWGEYHNLDKLGYPQQVNDILKASYKRVITGLQATALTLLPKHLFDSSHIAPAARMLDVNSDELIITEPLDGENIMLYKVNEMLVNAFKELGNKQIVYADAGWINSISKTNPLNTDLYLNIVNNRVSILNFKNNKLRFYNTFSFANHEELVYFCALVATELEIDQKNAGIILSGNVNTADRQFTYLTEFFSEVRLNSLQVLDIPHQIEGHKILSLAALILCASSEEN